VPQSTNFTALKADALLLYGYYVIISYYTIWLFELGGLTNTTLTIVAKYLVN
jgi:hypothetical protein